MKEECAIAYVSIPKDLSKVKTKFIFNLTKRQVICFGSGILVGLPLFFLLRGSLPVTAAALIMIIAMMPFFLFALYERNGEPLEKYLHHIIVARFRHPKQRPYQTQNFYAVLTKQAEIDREVKAIVKGKKK